ncbi:MAG: T9SS type A sorting domain-containing protein [Bacteroidetes bacterium]|nr:T9SS type A sorting domain-containing protein [Bacteroidota bacterium]
MRKHILFIVSALIFLTGFTYYYVSTQYWYQQSMPDLGGRQLTDLKFLDSLTGFACTDGSSTDNCYILKTTNGGDNWNIVFIRTYKFTKIGFIDKNTGYVSSNNDTLYKTTNGGNSWITIQLPEIYSNDMFVLNKDTLWLVDDNPTFGGAFLTTNGGVNWQRKYNVVGSGNPSKVYMINYNTGFITYSTSPSAHIIRTTNAGNNWFDIPNSGGFTQMYFWDTLNGCKAPFATYFEKTTNGGLNWSKYYPPQIPDAGFLSFKVLNRDTIWAVGGKYRIGLSYRAVVWKTTNGGVNWGYQIPDPVAIPNNATYNFIDFSDNLHGWAYTVLPSFGIHTVTGGDTTIYLTEISNSLNETVSDFKLFQNYPNPYNPSTKINYELRITNYVTLKVFDLSGKEVETLVNKKQIAGSYSIDFNASYLSSGVYFYTLQTENYKETKKMLLIK